MRSATTPAHNHMFHTTYDATGNVTNDGTHTYGYDCENRLVFVDSGSTASYSYDYQNRRYKRTVGSAITHYLWQGSRVLAEHNGSTGAVVIDYIVSGNRTTAKVVSGSTSYLLSDRLSVRLPLDMGGAVVGRQAHLPFGEDFAESGNQDKHHLTTYERDSEDGLNYAINRAEASGPTKATYQSFWLRVGLIACQVEPGPGLCDNSD
jgi:hypothetical protein